jgi:hypothetical protein
VDVLQTGGLPIATRIGLRPESPWSHQESGKEFMQAIELVGAPLAPKVLPRDAKVAPKSPDWPQKCLEGPRSAQKCPKVLEKGPKLSQKWVQNRPPIWATEKG